MRGFLIFFIGIAFFSTGQNLVITFNVELNGNKIGTVKATKSADGPLITKNLSSNTKANILTLSVHVESEIYMTSRNEQLISSFAYRQVSRGSDNIETTVKHLPSNQYKIVKNGKTQLLNKNINFCIVDLYFKEPKGHHNVFSNTHGEFLEIKIVASGKYELELPDGKTNVFTYVNGKLIQVEAKLTVGKVIFKRV